jgi:hypothetical protein
MVKFKNCQNHRQRDYHPMPYFSIGPPMPGSWGSSPMMYPSCPPWSGWYKPWAPMLMHFYPGWSRPAGGFDHRRYYTGDDHYGSVDQQQEGGSQSRKPRQPRIPNRTIRFPRRHQQPLVSSTGSGFVSPNLLLMVQGAVRVRQGRGMKLPPMTKWSTAQKKSRGGCNRAEQSPR